MAINNGDVMKGVMEVTLADGSIAQNVYYLKAVLAAPQSDATALAEWEAWFELMYSAISAYLVSTIVQNVCTLSVVEFNATEALWEVVREVGLFTPTIGFNDAAEALPNQSCALATFNTSRPKSRGRKFLFPFGEDAQAATFLTGAVLTAMASYASRVLGGINIGPLNDFVFGVIREGVDSFLEATVAVVTNVIATQRRRRPGVGA